MHINPAKYCVGCGSKIIQCDYRIVPLIEYIQAQFPDCHIAVGYRDQADQHHAFESHLSTFDWPHSKHNICDDNGVGKSLAVDLFRLGEDNKAYFEVQYYERLWKLICLDPSMVNKYAWGGNYHHLKDYDHFECVT